MSEVHITVNDKSLTAEAGELLIDVCRRNGVDIPAFCSYPGLSPQGACRMCLVEVERMPKMQTACTTAVAEGMIVRTETEQVRQARKATLELLLANHPLDCPTCDAGGECELQDMTFACGAGESKFVEIKAHREEQQWSPAIFYDRPRCIMCYRCVRVCGEAMDVWALGVAGRGQNALIMPNGQNHLDCEQCGMCVDICPVGALTSGGYRHKTRPWEMRHKSTVCMHCADGCRVTLGVRAGAGGAEIVRADNRDRNGLNGEFLCAKGRFGFDLSSDDGRLRQPLVRRDKGLEPATWPEALQIVAGRLRRAMEQKDGAAIGVIGSNHLTNEENYLLQKFARVTLGVNNIDHHRTADYAAFARALARHNGCEASVAESANAPAILMIGGDATTRHPMLAWHVRNNVRLRKARLYVVNSRRVKLFRQATLSALTPPEREAQFIDFLCGAGPATPLLTNETNAAALRALREALVAEPSLLVVLSGELDGATIERMVEWGSTRGARFLLLGDHANSRGAADMGVLPDLLPGYTALADGSAFAQAWGCAAPAQPGLDIRRMLEPEEGSALAALYVVGANPRRSLTSLMQRPDKPFLIVQDAFLTESAQLADVVLPALTFYEKSGTATNSSGDVQRLTAAGETHGAKSDLEIILRLASALGADVERLSGGGARRQPRSTTMRGPHSGEADRHALWLEGHEERGDYAPFSPDALLDELQKLTPGYDFPRQQWIAQGSARVTMRPSRPEKIQDAGALVKPAANHLFTSGSIGRRIPLLRKLEDGE